MDVASVVSLGIVFGYLFGLFAVLSAKVGGEAASFLCSLGVDLASLGLAETGWGGLSVPNVFPAVWVFNGGTSWNFIVLAFHVVIIVMAAGLILDFLLIVIGYLKKVLQFLHFRSYLVLHLFL